jgi:hypothetical protein
VQHALEPVLVPQADQGQLGGLEAHLVALEHMRLRVDRDSDAVQHGTAAVAEDLSRVAGWTAASDAR